MFRPKECIKWIVLLVLWSSVGLSATDEKETLNNNSTASALTDDSKIQQIKDDYRVFKKLRGANKNAWLQNGEFAKKALIGSSRLRLKEFKNQLKNSEKAKSKMKVFKDLAKSAPVGGLQTYLVIVSCALIEVMKAEYERGAIDIRLWSPEQVMYESGKAIREVVDSNSMMAGLAGSTLLGVLADPLVNRLFADPKLMFSSPIFQKLLGQMVHMFFSFGAFEIFSELVDEATERLPDYFDKNDPVVGELLKDRSHILTQIILALKPRFNKVDEKKSEIAAAMFKQVFVNIAEILSDKDDYLVIWLYNSIRHRILTGQFMSLIASLSVANTAGGLLVEAPRFSWSLVFNLIGAMGSSYIPEKKKNNATKMMQNARIWFNDVLQSGKQLQYQWTKVSNNQLTAEDSDKTIDDWIKKRRSYRERKIDIFWEMMYYNYNQVLSQRGLYEEITKLPGSEVLTSLQSKLSEIQANNEFYYREFIASIFSIIKIYESEAHFINDYRSRVNIEETNLSTEVNNMESLFRHFCELYNRFSRLNFYSLNGTIQPPDSIVGAINGKCDVRPSPKSAKIEELSPEVQKTLESSVVFLELYNSLGVDELKIIIDRNQAIRETLGDALSDIEP